MTQSGSLGYVETDLPPVVATKLDLLDDVRRRHDLAPSPLHIVKVADALDAEQIRTAAAVFDHDRPLMVLCEGLIGYLTRDETGRVAAHVRRLISEFGSGWWIVPDFAFKAEIRDLPPERLRLREAITGVTQRQLDASAFDDSHDLESFLHGVGFDVQVRSQVDETPSFSSIEALGLSPALIDRMRPALRVWVMTPQAHSASTRG
jgi:O-methyltransferase involved in polyketide biosynthesis